MSYYIQYEFCLVRLILSFLLQSIQVYFSFLSWISFGMF
jgi:hypothetical protein